MSLWRLFNNGDPRRTQPALPFLPTSPNSLPFTLDPVSFLQKLFCPHSL